MRYLAIAFLSGVPALAYELVWMREVALVAGSQTEATATVLAAFFGGLALGARLFGAGADRVSRPLRRFAALEAGGAVLSLISLFVLRSLADSFSATLSTDWLLVLATVVVIPPTVLLGGTLPTLLCASASEPRRAARVAGALTAANTAGGVVGVVLASLAIPQLGLMATLVGAAAGALMLAGSVALLGGRGTRGNREPAESTAAGRTPWLALAVAGLAGVSTLAFEGLAARMGALQMGSSLFAVAAILVFFLLGLAGGNALLARRAQRSEDVARDLAWVEFAAAAAIVFGLFVLAPSATTAASGLGLETLLRLALGVLPATLCMGAAFPLCVRLAVGDAGRVGASFGLVSATNTAGGVAGSLVAIFVLLPTFGPAGGALACAGLNAVVGAALLLRSQGGMGAVVRIGSATAAIAALALLALRPEAPVPGSRVIAIEHGRQATAAVVRTAGRRDLIVDGESEASTGGAARSTEMLLAVLPLMLHPDPRDYMEVGLGSGITLGTAARFPLETLRCVELAQSVVDVSFYFAPDNGDPVGGTDSRITVERGDGRAALAAAENQYDVIAANTVHPWSVGATGLYSAEYFGRIARALRPGGLAVQWLPLAGSGADSLAAILRTFFLAFPDGALFWGANNVLLVGSNAPMPAPNTARFDSVSEGVAGVLRALDLPDAASVTGRRIASARLVLDQLGPGEQLSDDRPILETRSARRRGRSSGAAELELIDRIARAATADDPAVGPLSLWISSQAARARGEDELAASLETLAEEAGFAPARTARAARLVAEGRRAIVAGDAVEGSGFFARAVELDPAAAAPRFGLALLAAMNGDEARSESLLTSLLELDPSHSEGWNLLGSLLARRGLDEEARRAFESALREDPYYPEALTNLGLLAARNGRLDEASEALSRLRDIVPLGEAPEVEALAAAITSVDPAR